MPRDPSNNGRRPAKRGFASMDPERQREIARKGGASVPSEKRSFSQDRSLAAQAGRKGGEASHGARGRDGNRDRKSTRLNSSHSQISYAVFCLKKKIEP